MKSVVSVSVIIIYIYIVRQSGRGGGHKQHVNVIGSIVHVRLRPVNDINTQSANLIGSMNLCNTKLCVADRYFCCTILYHRRRTVGG